MPNMKSKWTPWVVGAICLFVGFILGQPSSSDYVESADTKTSAKASESVYHLKDFAVDLHVKSKQCFGSAGCNETVGIEPKYVGPKKKRPDGKWEVTFEISGDESGPIVRTFSVQGSKMTFDESVDLSPPTNAPDSVATITSVRKLS